MLKRLRNFFYPPVENVLLALLDDTRRDLLMAEAHLDDARASVDKYRTRLARLENGRKA